MVLIVSCINTTVISKDSVQKKDSFLYIDEITYENFSHDVYRNLVLLIILCCI